MIRVNDPEYIELVEQAEKSSAFDDGLTFELDPKLGFFPVKSENASKKTPKPEPLNPGESSSDGLESKLLRSVYSATPTTEQSTSQQNALYDPLKLCKLIHGMWQVDGNHGYDPRPEDVLPDILEVVDAGYGTFELSPTYGSACDMIQQMTRTLGKSVALQNTTVIFTYAPEPMRCSKAAIVHAIDKMLMTAQREILDLVQLHWWGGEDDTRYMQALRELQSMKALGKIKYLGLANFGYNQIVNILDDSGGSAINPFGFSFNDDSLDKEKIRIVSNMVPLSLIDQRALGKVSSLCQDQGISLICYGCLCGGLLSDKYVGMPDPGPHMLSTPALRKYYGFIMEWGSWDLFQELLLVLKHIGEKHGFGVAQVALKWVMDQTAVGAIIVGRSFGNIYSSGKLHFVENSNARKLKLDADDLERIQSITCLSSNLTKSIGDIGYEFLDKSGGDDPNRTMQLAGRSR